MAQRLMAAVKSPRVLLAAFLYIAMLVMLYLIQYPLFDGAFATPFLYVLLYTAIIFLGWIFRGRAEPRGKPNIVWRVVEIFLIVGIIAVCAWSVYNDRYYLIGYQGLALVIAIGAIFIRKYVLRLEKFTKHDSTLCIVMFASAIISTALFFAVVRPVTIQGAKNMLADEGYGEVTYVMHVLHNTFDDSGDISALSGSGVYLMSGVRDGEEYAMLVNLTRREIVRVFLLSENEDIKDTIELVQKNLLDGVKMDDRSRPSFLR